MKVREMRIAVDSINKKEAAEQQDLGEQEEPHADLCAGVVAAITVSDFVHAIFSCYKP